MRALAVVVWFFFAASSLLGGILLFFELPQAQPGSGPGAPLEGVAFVMGIGILIGCLVVFVLCLRFRPAPAAFTWRNCALAVGAYALCILGAFGLTRSERYTLIARVLDSAGQPVPEAEVRFNSFPLGEGLGRYHRVAKGRTVTD